MKTVRNPVFLLWFVASVFVQCSTNYDVVIKNGILYDGSGNAPYATDIGITNGIIREIGTIRTGKSQVIDASGLYVSPGFIDIHTHCDRGLTQPGMSAAQNYLTQGVTTVVTGNCGSGTYRVKEFFHYLDSTGTGPNVVHLVGHNTVRIAVMGEADRAPEPEELEQMKKLFATGMRGGAAGFSTGLFYAPGSFAETNEIIEIAKTVKDFNGIYASHIRDESNYSVGLIASIEEAIAIGEEADIPVQVSHIKALGKPVWGLSKEACAVIENARDRGITVMADQYPYPASSTSLAAAVIPRWVQADGAMQSRLTDTNLLPGIKKEIAGNITRRVGSESLIITSFAENPSFNGKSLAEISELLGKPVEETAIDLVMKGNPTIISFNMSEQDVHYFMQKDYIMTSSDGHLQFPGVGMPHPRSYGAFTLKIRKYVLEDQLISMEHAIRAATALPAKMLGLKNRGMIDIGFAADLVVFDPETIRDLATFENPHQYSEGIIYLLVNGKIVIEDGVYNGTLAGQTLPMNKR